MEEEGGLTHSVGVGALDPWILNTQTKRMMGGDGGTIQALQNPHCVAPEDREEAEGMFSSALATKSRHSNPLDLFHLLTAL